MPPNLNAMFIASDKILWVKKDGSETTINIKIGAPFQNDNLNWKCPSATDGYDGRNVDIVGATSLQALSLALNLVYSRLKHLFEAGETLYAVDDDRSMPLSIEWLNATFGRSK